MRGDRRIAYESAARRTSRPGCRASESGGNGMAEMRRTGGGTRTREQGQTNNTDGRCRRHSSGCERGWIRRTAGRCEHKRRELTDEQMSPDGRSRLGLFQRVEGVRYERQAVRTQEAGANGRPDEPDGRSPLALFQRMEGARYDEWWSGSCTEVARDCRTITENGWIATGCADVYKRQPLACHASALAS